MSGSRDIISAEYRELFNELSRKKKFDVDKLTNSSPRKLQASKIGRQQFGKLIARVFLLQIFSCTYRCFECTIKQLLDEAKHIKNHPGLG